MIIVKKGETFFDAIQRHKLNIDTSCGGKKKCGKCKIHTLDYIKPCKLELSLLTAKEIKNNIRLACMHGPLQKDMAIEEVQEQDEFQILSDDMDLIGGKEQGYVAGIDIGTTTVVLCIYEIHTAKKVEEYKFLNPQRIYGADVISRIQACKEIGLSVLHDCLIQEINLYLSKSTYSIKRLCVCGNAVMTHIFMNEDPSSIGAAPYICKVNEFRFYSSKEFFDLEYEFEVQVLPPLSAYVGSDILMGIYILSLKEKELLMDLGTNGEMVYKDQDQYIVTSAACGPAFEGGHMKCGTGAIAGAVDKVWFDQSLKYHTFQDKEAIGVCGNGYISWLATLLKMNVLQESGYMEQDFYLCDDIVLTKKDIREFQLSKSAITAALDCLLQDKEVKKVYLSGGFSKSIDIEDCMRLGIFSRLWKDKVSISGNTALRGICQYALLQDKEKIEEIQRKSKTISLMENSLFFDRFVDNMYFVERE